MGQRQITFAIPAGAGTYAPTTIICRPDNATGLVDQVLELEVNIVSLPVAATILVEQLKLGGDPTVDAHWLLKATLNAIGPQTLIAFSGWSGVRIRGKSGGTLGNAELHAAWLSSGD